jgi:hypothetical protein
MRFRIFLTMLLLTLALMRAAAPASAVSGSSVLGFTVQCDFFSVTYTDVVFDRDNTGSGAEAFTGIITDGDGNMIAAFADARLLGDTIPAFTEDFFYGVAPVSNPIRFRLVSDAGNGLPEQVIWDLTGLSPCLPPPPFQGAGIPAGFVMHHITCTTPVYTEAAGVPVGSDQVLAGQTWYVDPTPVEGTDGQQWTEIFVGSFINPWIPSVCVGGIAS